ncbi:DUF1566 domain-containing protein [Shewanella sp. AS16]|uniref:Lcl C-terminal domain-containing protein n=1 Tax=Shewanella sp. AS16 TaxID=2907625 RepID=UPI001F1AADB1|nr:DUF1566 domain-containing protein [Shewanella sp. AS16]MCE9685810.1 DUF1566 domain-containing protein [Shewanella sp. AS16]
MNKCIRASIKLAMTSIKTPPSIANQLLLSILATTLISGCGGSEGVSNDDTGQVTPIVYSIPATASLGGKISPVINMVESGHATTFTVTPDIGYQVDDISGCGGSLTQKSYKTAVINAQCSVTVSFKLSTYKITTQATTGGQISPESIDVSYNTHASFNLSTDIGYQIESVSGCNGTLNNNEFMTDTITSDCQINATFTKIGDGALAERYIDNGNGTITDTQTKLMWMRCSLGQTWQNWSCKGTPSTFNWLYASDLSYSDGNHSDWRLPTKEELNSLIFCSSGKPSYWKPNDELCMGDFESPTIAQTAFPQTPIGPFWTSTAQDTDSVGYRWSTYFNFGHGQWSPATLNIYVRLVRIEN